MPSTLRRSRSALRTLDCGSSGIVALQSITALTHDQRVMRQLLALAGGWWLCHFTDAARIAQLTDGRNRILQLDRRVVRVDRLMELDRQRHQTVTQGVEVALVGFPGGIAALRFGVEKARPMLVTDDVDDLMTSPPAGRGQCVTGLAVAPLYRSLPLF